MASRTLEAVGRGDIARRVQAAPDGASFGVLDPFAGSCNGLYWVLRHVPTATARGFELDPTVFALTSRNLALLDRPIERIEGNYREQFERHRFAAHHHLVVFLAPPWADALDATTGLDLGRTRPPIAEIVADMEPGLSCQSDPLRRGGA